METPTKAIAILPSKIAAEQLEAACQRYMQNTVARYCAERWAEIYWNEKTGQRAFYTDYRVEPAISKAILDTRVASISETDWKIERLTTTQAEPVIGP